MNLPLKQIAAIQDMIRKCILPCYEDDEPDRPTARGGLYWNPIVQCHSRNLKEAYEVLADRCSVIITVEGPFLEQVLTVKDELEPRHTIRAGNKS